MPIVIVVGWILVTAIAAYLFAYLGVHSPTAVPGYETEWRFHLVMFAVFVLPFLACGLALLLWIERRWFLKHRGSSAVPD
jgi:hypothetical protein